jgi:hypothetical protein
MVIEGHNVTGWMGVGVGELHSQTTLRGMGFTCFLSVGVKANGSKWLFLPMRLIFD